MHADENQGLKGIIYRDEGDEGDMSNQETLKHS